MFNAFLIPGEQLLHTLGGLLYVLRGRSYSMYSSPSAPGEASMLPLFQQSCCMRTEKASAPCGVVYSIWYLLRAAAGRPLPEWDLCCVSLCVDCRLIVVNSTELDIVVVNKNTFCGTRYLSHCCSLHGTVVDVETSTLKGERNPKIKLDLNDFFFTLINKYNSHIF